MHGLSVNGVQFCGRVMIGKPTSGLGMDAGRLHGVKELHACSLDVVAEGVVHCRTLLRFWCEALPPMGDKVSEIIAIYE